MSEPTTANRWPALSAQDQVRLRAFSERMPLVPADYLPGYGPRFDTVFTIGTCRRLQFMRFLFDRGRLLP